MGVGFAGDHLSVVQVLVSYANAHAPGSRWVLLTDAATTAAPMILLGYRAGSLAGYSGTDPVLDGAGLARLVSRGEARYVVLGGQFSSRGGNRATAAVLRACAQVPPEAWHDPALSPFGLVPYDCRGRERALALGAGAIHGETPALGVGGQAGTCHFAATAVPRRKHFAVAGIIGDGWCRPDRRHTPSESALDAAPPQPLQRRGRRTGQVRPRDAAGQRR